MYKVKKHKTTVTPLAPLSFYIEKYLADSCREIKNLPPPINKIYFSPSEYQDLEKQAEKLIEPSYKSRLGIDIFSNPILPPNIIMTVSQDKYTLFDVSGQEATIIAEFPKIDFFRIPPPRLERNLYAKRNE